MHYTKSPLSFEDQLDKLIGRGLIVRDRDQALKSLSNINYYRLRAYWYPFETGGTTHQFKSGTTFEQILRSYQFDKKLRSLLFDAIELIEVAVKTQIIYHYSMKYGGQWPFDSSLFHNATEHAGFERICARDLNQSNEVFIQHYQDKYTNPINPPAWMLLEIISLGTASKLYKNLKTSREKKAIAKHFGLHFTVLESWIEHLTYIRNLCAHHSRVWNRKAVIQAIYPTRVVDTWLEVPIALTRRSNIYLTISILRYLHRRISLGSEYMPKVKSLMLEFPDIPLEYLGMPDMWAQDSFWN